MLRPRRSPRPLGRRWSRSWTTSSATPRSRTGSAGRPARRSRMPGRAERENRAAFGLAGQPPGRVVVSAIEHPAVRERARELERRGFEVACVAVDRNGVVDADAFAELVRPGDRLAAVMWANNVTGAVQ